MLGDALACRRNHGDSESQPIDEESKSVVEFDTLFDGAARDVIAVIDDLQKSVRLIEKRFF